MRVTNKMLSNSFLSDMRNNLSNMQTLQQQLTSGKEIRRPSDNPAKVARAMQLHTDINANKQFKENINDTVNWLDTTDTALGQAGDVLQRVRELLISAGNAAYGSNERKSIKDEINQRVDELSQILNTSYDGKFIFGGTRGDEKPLKTTLDADGNISLNYNVSGNAADIQKELDTKLGKKLFVEISPGVSMDYNVNASEILGFKNENNEDTDVRELLKSIISHMEGKNYTSTNIKYNDTLTEDPVSALSGKDLKGITDVISNILKIRAEVGAKQTRMEGAKEKNEEETFNLTSVLSRTEDIDITEKTMQYATMQTVYMASLQTSAKVLQPTLLDYLR